MLDVRLTVSAIVFPTERRERVEEAVLNIFPGLELRYLVQEGFPDRVEGKGGLDSLRNLHLLLREERILDTARSVLLEGRRGNSIEFRLSKQVAFVGKANFPPAEETLGSIYVTVEADDPMLVIDWLAPQTLEGKPIREIEL